MEHKRFSYNCDLLFQTLENTIKHWPISAFNNKPILEIRNVSNTAFN